MSGERTVAALDIGTNTLLLLVATRRGDELACVREECRFGRLGQGVDETGALSDEAVERSLAILREYRELIDEVGADRVAAVGTQTLREVDNAGAFLDRAAEILGVPIEVITGEREAELVFRSARASFPELAASGLAVADVGGGSTEIIVGAGGGVTSYRSVPIGSVRLTERQLRADPPTGAERDALAVDIDAALAPLDLPPGTPLLGTAGTATTMAAVSLALPRFDPDAIHGARLEPAEVHRQAETLLGMSVAERRALPGMQPERADVIAAGAAIFDRLVHRLAAPAMWISARGVRWGVAEEAAAAGP